MQVHILYFAIIAQKLGQSEQSLQLPDNATVAHALDALQATHPTLAPLREGLATAVNMAYVKPDHVLKDGDELALIPPVSGG